MTRKDNDTISRRDFMARSGSAALAGALAAGLPGETTAQGQGRYNILMIVTDQERYFRPDELPADYRLPGHEKLVERGITFENHQVASCVCTPSRAVLYTGQHIQNNGMFDNTNFPWSGDLSLEIRTLGDMLRAQGYYTAYKGKWHLTSEFETANSLNNPRRVLNAEMEEYGFADYLGFGDIIAHTEGGFLHDGVIAGMTQGWLRGQARMLRDEGRPWFMAVNLVNPHDVMYYNTDLPGAPPQQAGTALSHLNHAPDTNRFSQRWNMPLPVSRSQPLSAPGRPAAHEDYILSRAGLVGRVPNEDARWRRLNDYYLNCIQEADHHVLSLLKELEDLGLAERTIIVYTADHGELAGAHGLSGKGATGYREQMAVPLIVSHPDLPGRKRCRAVTSHLDIAPTLLSFAGGSGLRERLPGRDLSILLRDPETAAFDALRPGALFNFNMLAYLDRNFLPRISQYIREGGSLNDIADQGFKPDLSKRGAIRSLFDGRYFAPLEHHVPRSLEELFANNDVELFDLESDPHEMQNLALDRQANGELLLAMNEKLNALIEAEVGDDIGQMLPGGADANWTLDPSIKNLRM